MPMVNFTENNNQEPANIEELIKTGESGEIQAYAEEFVPEKLGAQGNAHQPFVVAIDASGSMSADAGNGKSKLQVCQELINSLPQSDNMKKLSEVERNTVDMLILSFSGDEVNVNAVWQPISLFEGVGSISYGTTTPFYKTVVNSIQATRVMRHSYGEKGVDCKRPQIFIYTDGLATDKSENYAEAKALCEKYAEVDGKVKIFVVLIPGSMSEDEINRVCTEIISLSDNITVLKAEDCVNGLPATFNFISSSVVAGASSSVGDQLIAEYDPKYIKVAGNTPANNGSIITGTQIQWN